MGVEPKIGVKTPKMGWWKSWKALLIHGWFGGKTLLFSETSIYCKNHWSMSEWGDCRVFFGRCFFSDQISGTDTTDLSDCLYVCAYVYTINIPLFIFYEGPFVNLHFPLLMARGYPPTDPNLRGHPSGGPPCRGNETYTHFMVYAQSTVDELGA